MPFSTGTRTCRPGRTGFLGAVQPASCSASSAQDFVTLAPNPLSEDEKNTINSAVAKSMEEHIDYKYWVNIDPMDSPPPNDEDDEPAPKRVRINEAKIFELGSEEHVTDQAQ